MSEEEILMIIVVILSCIITLVSFYFAHKEKSLDWFMAGLSSPVIAYLLVGLIPVLIIGALLSLVGYIVMKILGFFIDLFGL